MRSYPCNSPHAAARVVVLAALADGHFSPSELAALERLDALTQLGLSREELHEIVRHLSEDLMATVYPQWGTACQIDACILHALMAEVTNPVLRRTALALCVEVAKADSHVADAEENLIATAARRWLMDSPSFTPVN